MGRCILSGLGRSVQVIFCDSIRVRESPTVSYLLSAEAIRTEPFSSVIAGGTRKSALLEMSRLRAGLCIALFSEQLSHIVPIDDDIRYQAIVDISPVRDDVDWSHAKQLFQPQSGGLSARLVQFRRVDATESDALGSISKRVTINHLDLPAVDYALDATEWYRGLPVESRSNTLGAGSAHHLGFFVRMEFLLTMKSMGLESAPGSWFRLPAEITRGAHGGIGR